jgi:hypothetical protein
MATDPEFREGVRSNDPAVVAGLDLTADEIAQLQSLSSDESGAGVEQLDARLSKSSLGGFFGSSMASLHGGADAPHSEAGSYTPEQHDAASAPVPLTERSVTFHDTAASNAPPGGGNYPHSEAGFNNDPSAQHAGTHGDAGYEKPDMPDGGPKPPKLDSFISDQAVKPEAGQQESADFAWVGDDSPVAEG